MDSAYPEPPENPESLEVILIKFASISSLQLVVRIILTFLSGKRIFLISSTPSSSLAANWGGKTHTGLYGKGDISITPAKPFFACWDSNDHYLQISCIQSIIQNTRP